MFGDIINELFGVMLISQFWLEGKCYDYKIPNKNILIECDGKHWHSSPEAIENDKIKNEIAQRNGYVLYRFAINEVKEVKLVIEKNKELLREIMEIEKLQKKYDE